MSLCQYRKAAQGAIDKLKADVARVGKWVNTMNPYITAPDFGPIREVESIPHLMDRLKGMMLNVLYRGDWQQQTEYQLNNVVKRPDNNYLATAPHTSSDDFDADLAAGLWIIYGSIIINSATEDTEGIGFLATQAEASSGTTDPSRGGKAAFINPEGMQAFANNHWPQQATPNNPGISALATPDDFVPDPETGKIDDTKIVTPRLFEWRHGIPGLVHAFSGRFGGPDNKYPINLRMENPDPEATDPGMPDLRYVLCDGGTYTSLDGREVQTPDLRSRFILGADEKHSQGETGGSTTHTHGVVVDPHTLTVAEMPGHSHPYHVKDTTDGYGSRGLIISGVTSLTVNNTTRAPVVPSTSVIGNGEAHDHDGSTLPDGALPPFYALAFILEL